MKLSNTVVSVIVIAAVLVSAYALGLLIRQARTGAKHVPAPVEVNSPAGLKAISSPGPGAGRTTDTPEERAKIKEQKAQEIEKKKAMTPEEKQKFREQIRKQVSGRQPGKGPKDFAPVRQNKKAEGPAAAGGPKEDANTPAAPGDSTSAKPNAEKAGAVSGQAGPGGVQP